MFSVVARAGKFLLSILPGGMSVRAFYLYRFRRFPDLKNPSRLTEKIAWRKLNQRDPRFIVFADKLAVKDEIARLAGPEYVIPTYWSGENPDEIPYDKIEYPCVVKVNHHSGEHVFLRSRADVDKEKISGIMRKLLGQTHGKLTKEWAYTRIPRRVLVEQMLINPEGAVPEDYKFFVFHGRVEFVQVDYGRFTQQVRGFFSRDWELLPVIVEFPSPSSCPPRPATFTRMIEIAEKVGRQFDFARVDLYSCGDRIYFGEATFYPMNGQQRYRPEEWDTRFGSSWSLAHQGRGGV